MEPTDTYLVIATIRTTNNENNIGKILIASNCVLNEDNNDFLLFFSLIFKPTFLIIFHHVFPEKQLMLLMFQTFDLQA